MKLRTLLVLILIILMVFIIYIFTKDNQIYYVNFIDTEISDKTYNEYLKEEINNNKKLEYYQSYYKNDYRITDLIRDIKDNIKIEEKNIQNLLIKADVLTIMIGNNELKYKISNTNMNDLFDYSDSLLKDCDELLEILRKYCKEKIFVIGLSNDSGSEYDKLYNYINIRLEDLCKKYNIEFIGDSEQFNGSKNVKIYKKIEKNIDM